MTTIYDCAMDDVLLSSLDARICILDIREDAPDFATSELALHKAGTRTLLREMARIRVRVTFAIHEEDPIRRREVLTLIRRWAEGGDYLTITPRPGLRMAAVCTALPGLSSRDWAEELTLAFASAYAPYWEQVEQTSLSATADTTFTAPGTADFAPVSVSVLNTTGAVIPSVTITCGDTHMTFEDINIPAGKQFTVGYAIDRLIAKVNSDSVLHHRTADSDDDLLAPCGQAVAVSVAAAGTPYIFYNSRGRYV